jgi:hypothetical protein
MPSGASPAAFPTPGFAWRAGPIDAFTNGDETALRLMPNGGALSVRHGRLFRGDGYAETPRANRQFLARVGAIVRLRSRGRFHMHAAGAVDPAGRGWLLVGENGAGKSTLTYALARAGWKALGDDGVILERTTGGIIAHAWREPLCVSRALTAEFPELAANTAIPFPDDERERIPMRCAIAQRAPVAALVFLRRGDRDVIEPVPPAEALTLLVRQSMWVLMADGYAASNLSVLQELAAQARVFRLTHTSRQLREISATLTGAIA